MPWSVRYLPDAFSTLHDLYLAIHATNSTAAGTGKARGKGKGNDKGNDKGISSNSNIVAARQYIQQSMAISIILMGPTGPEYLRAKEKYEDLVDKRG